VGAAFAMKTVSLSGMIFSLDDKRIIYIKFIGQYYCEPIEILKPRTLKKYGPLKKKYIYSHLIPITLLHILSFQKCKNSHEMYLR
jgi:hypothetical protein